MDFLLSKGVNTEAKDGTSSTPLTVAAQARQGEAVHLLLAYGANVNAATHHGVTALWYASAQLDVFYGVCSTEAQSEPQLSSEQLFDDSSTKPSSGLAIYTTCSSGGFEQLP